MAAAARVATRDGAGSDSELLEATPRIELGMEVLQTSALPLGYVAAIPASILPSPPPASAPG